MDEKLPVVSKYDECNRHDITSFQRFGTKHVVATNMILWLGTVIKESVEEIVEQGKEAESVSTILVMPRLFTLLNYFIEWLISANIHLKI